MRFEAHFPGMRGQAAGSVQRRQRSGPAAMLRLLLLAACARAVPAGQRPQ